MEKVEGSWSGRLIDIGGFEGEVSLSLQQKRRSLEGFFEAAIDGQHRPVRIRGKVSGEQKGNTVALLLNAGDQDRSVSIVLEGEVIVTRRKELAVCGRYDVSGRRSSALMGGVISLRQPAGETRPETMLERSVVATPQGTAEPAKPRKRAKAKGEVRTSRKGKVKQ